MAFLTDGFPTLISLAGLAGVVFKEKTVTPPAIDGGGPNDTTTMRNTRWRTRQPKKLATLTMAESTVSYDPLIYTQLVAQLQVNQELSIQFPDGQTLIFWGWADKLKPNEIKEGEQPTAHLTIECSNQDDSGTEIAPSIT